MRKKSCAKEATMFNKLQQTLRDVRSQQETNKTLSQLIRDMEIERAAMNKAHENSLEDLKLLRAIWGEPSRIAENCSPSNNVWKRKTTQYISN
jgi:hypothetical protein